MKRLALVAGPILLALVFFRPFLQQGRAFFAVHTDYWDAWREFAPRDAVARADRQINPVMTDTLLQHHPEVWLNVQSLRHGELPTWNPYVLGGLPHIATGIAATFYPFGLLSLMVDPPTSYGWAAFLQASLAGILMAVFLRRRGLHLSASLLGATLFAFSGWMSTHMAYYQISGSAIWLPLMLLGVDLVHERHRRAGVAALAVATGCSWLAGFPQISLISLLVAGGWTLARSAGRARAEGVVDASRCLIRCGLAVCLGTALGAAQFVPSITLALSPDTNRPIPDPAALERLSLEPAALATVLAPDIFGHPQWAKSLESDKLGRSLLAATFLSPSSNYMEIQLYLSLLALLLVPFGLLARPRALSALGAGLVIVGLGASLGGPLQHLLMALPGMSVGDPKRYLYLVSTGLAVLAALGLHRLIGKTPRRGILTVALIVGLLGAGLLAGAWQITRVAPDQLRQTMAHLLAEGRLGQITSAGADQFAAHIPATDLEANRMLISGSLIRTALGLALGTLVLLGFLGRRKRWAAALALLLVAADLTLVGRQVDLPGGLAFLGRGFNRPMTIDGFYRPTPLTDFLKENQGDEPWRICRFGTQGHYPRKPADLLFPPKTLQVEGIEDAQGYVALYLKRYQLFQEALEPSPAPGQERTSTTYVACFSRPETLASKAFALLGVRYVLAREPITVPGLELVARHDAIRIYRAEGALPRAFVAPAAVVTPDLRHLLEAIRKDEISPLETVLIDPEGHAPPPTMPAVYPEGPTTVTWLRHQPRRLQLEVNSPGGWLVVTDNYAPGWEATVDGQPETIHPAFAAFRTIHLSPGRHEVTMIHAAPAEKVGLAVSLLAILVLIGLAAWRPRRPEATPP